MTNNQLTEFAERKVKHLTQAIGQSAFTSIRLELENELALAKFALSALQEHRKAAEPVGDEELDQMIWKLERDGMTPKMLSLMRELREVRRAKPVVPNAVDENIDADDHPLLWAHNKGWNACRAAMPQTGNSPVIPDGWVMVPAEPTEAMIINGFESEPDEFFSEEQDWEAYEAMSGCQQAAHRAKLCYAAMLSAAPKEVG